MKAIEQIVETGVFETPPGSRTLWEETGPRIARAAIAACAEEIRAHKGRLFYSGGAGQAGADELYETLAARLEGAAAATPAEPASMTEAEIAYAQDLEEGAGEDEPPLLCACGHRQERHGRDVDGQPYCFETCKCQGYDDGCDGAPLCESCGQPADGRSLDDVPLCSRCGEALAAEQEGKQ